MGDNPAKFTAKDIKVLSVPEAIRKRPGMYLGDLGRVGAARLIGMALDTLAGATAQADRPVFTYHAFLDIAVRGRQVQVTVDFHPKESPDFPDRCAALVKHREDLRCGVPNEPDRLADFPVLSALTQGLHFSASEGEPRTTFVADTPALPLDLSCQSKGAAIGMAFEIREQIKVAGITQDFLAGFIFGHNRWRGLVVRELLVG